MNKPIKVYRGLGLHTDTPIWDTLIVGQTVPLADIYPASSWTTEICVAAGFAKNGVVVSYLAQPDEVVLDTRLLDPQVLKELYKTIQFEIILDERTRDVYIELIIHGSQPVYRYTSE